VLLIRIEILNASKIVILSGVEIDLDENLEFLDVGCFNSQDVLKIQFNLLP